MTDQQPIYSSNEVRQAELAWAKKHGGSTWPLMQQAGQAAFECLQRNWPYARTIRIFCGSGNNGGDGYYLASLLLQQADYQVQVVANRAPDESKDAYQAFKAFQQQNGQVTSLSQLSTLAAPDLVVDALLGTGIQSPVSDAMADMIEAVNQTDCPVFALDVPSGLPADTGCTEVTEQQVHADTTLTFIAIKPGLVTGRALELTGDLHLATLGVENELNNLPVAAEWIQPSSFSVDKRSVASHKGDFGHLMVVGGHLGMGGAAILAAEAGWACGAGWVTLRTDEHHVAAALTRSPELMVQAWTSLAPTLPAKVQALVIGPGLGLDDWSRQQFQAFVHQSVEHKIPLVIDGDGLTLLSEHNQTYEQWVLTPHPGEAARLLACSVQDIEQDRIAAAKAIQQRYQGIVVLKGAGSVVASKDQVLINPTGHPAMARAGMGDVLSGMMGSLLMRQPDAVKAVCQAVWMHGRAAELALEDTDEQSLKTSDVSTYIPVVWQQLRKQQR